MHPPSGVQLGKALEARGAGSSMRARRPLAEPRREGNGALHQPTLVVSKFHLRPVAAVLLSVPSINNDRDGAGFSLQHELKCPREALPPGQHRPLPFILRGPRPCTVGCKSPHCGRWRSNWRNVSEGLGTVSGTEQCSKHVIVPLPAGMLGPTC